MSTAAGYLLIGVVAAGAGMAAALLSNGEGGGAQVASVPPVQAQHGTRTDRAAGARLVMFETAGCGWCRRFHKELEASYRSGPYQSRAPLVFASPGRKNGGYTLAHYVNAVPAFVLVDGAGREIDRRVGFPGDIETFHNQVHSMLAAAQR